MEGDRLSFLLKSVYDVLPSPTNLKTWGLSESPVCKLCGRPANLEHVLSSCRTALSDGRYIWRHDKVLSSIAEHLDQTRRAQKTVRKGPSLISFVKAGQEDKGAKRASGILGTASDWKQEVDLKNKLKFPQENTVTNLRPDRKTQKYMFSKCLLRHDVVRVFVSSLVLVFVRAILSWCP